MRKVVLYVKYLRRNRLSVWLVRLLVLYSLCVDAVSGRYSEAQVFCMQEL